MNLVSNSSFCLDLELEFELGVDNWCLALEFTVSILSCKIFTLAHCFFTCYFYSYLNRSSW